MRLRQLTIKNFRKIEAATIDFPKGLCVVVGENNAGKTAILDALRLMLFSGRELDALRLNEEDFRLNSSYAPIEIACRFCDLDEKDEVHFMECLVNVGEEKFEVQLNARAEFNTTTRRANVKMWGGETEGGVLPSNLYDRIAAIYLQPLRDPESGLRPGRNSQVARLLQSLTEKDRHAEFEGIATIANEQIRALEPVVKAKADVDKQMALIAGKELAQVTDLVFSDPTFHRIIAGLEPRIDGQSFTLNGLGYNNLVFTAMTLSTLKRSASYSHRSMLIEEPEAHLHPQLQVLLLRQLEREARSDDGNPVQVILSSHSPILASQASIDSLVAIQQTNDSIGAVCVASVQYDGVLKKKLQRFLDATRAELFFARRLLMVEGIAEAILLPCLTALAGGDLKASAVTVLNTDGINFNAFIPLFGAGKLNMRVAILTDGDDKKRTGIPSATASDLKGHESSIANLLVEFGQVTFEHELAKSANLLPLMLEAFEILRPILGKALKAHVTTLSGDEVKADAFLKELVDSETSKGEFAQELALLIDFVGQPKEDLVKLPGYTQERATLLESTKLSASDVPPYIRNAFTFLGVTKP
jgi:putative ATP-dependent endonuclease of OLD family